MWKSYDQLIASVYGFQFSRQEAKAWMNKRNKLNDQINDASSKFWKGYLNPKAPWAQIEKLLDRENDLRDELAKHEGFTLC